MEERVPRVNGNVEEVKTEDGIFSSSFQLKEYEKHTWKIDESEHLSTCVCGAKALLDKENKNPIIINPGTNYHPEIKEEKVAEVGVVQEKVKSRPVRSRQEIDQIYAYWKKNGRLNTIKYFGLTNYQIGQLERSFKKRWEKDDMGDMKQVQDKHEEDTPKPMIDTNQISEEDQKILDVIDKMPPMGREAMSSVVKIEPVILVPRFPEFNDNWSPVVQEKWLEIYERRFLNADSNGKS